MSASHAPTGRARASSEFLFCWSFGGYRGGLHIAKDSTNTFANGAEDIVDRPIRVNAREAELVGDRIELGEQSSLVLDVALVEVASRQEISPGLPVVEASRVHYPRDKVRQVCLEIEHSIRYEGEADKVAQPGLIHAPGLRTHDDGVDVAIGQYDETGSQGRNDLPPIGRRSRWHRAGSS